MKKFILTTVIIVIGMSNIALAQSASIEMAKNFFKFKKSYQIGSYKYLDARLDMDSLSCVLSDAKKDTLETFLIYWKGNEQAWKNITSNKSVSALGLYFDIQYRLFIKSESVKSINVNTNDGCFTTAKTQEKIFLEPEEIIWFKKRFASFLAKKWEKIN